jgi:hypothetical protein
LRTDLIVRSLDMSSLTEPVLVVAGFSSDGFENASFRATTGKEAAVVIRSDRGWNGIPDLLISDDWG